MIPPFDLDTGNLPPGIHEAPWHEIVERFGHTAHRRILLAGLRRALDLLRRFGCRRFYLDGSFVTAKEVPGDWDGCWEVEGVDVPRLALAAPLLWDDRPKRNEQKARYGGDLFPVNTAGDLTDRQILNDFLRDRRTGAPKGVIVIDLETLP